jgi:hypothetical protein
VARLESARTVAEEEARAVRRRTSSVAPITRIGLLVVVVAVGPAVVAVGGDDIAVAVVAGAAVGTAVNASLNASVGIGGHIVVAAAAAAVNTVVVGVVADNIAEAVAAYPNPNWTTVGGDADAVVGAA